MRLDDLLTAMKGMPHELIQRAAPEIAVAVREALLVTIRAHQAPDGTPWAPRKKGTRPVLNNAAEAMTTSAVGSRIYIVVRGINGRHHKGAVRGSVQRPIIIYKKHGRKAITPRIAQAIHDVVAQRFRDQIKAPGTSA